MVGKFHSLATLSESDQIYLGEDENGALQFRTDLARIWNQNSRLWSNVVLSLALTSLCREAGRGKVALIESIVEEPNG